jgi:hypothetical protein
VVVELPPTLVLVQLLLDSSNAWVFRDSSAGLRGAYQVILAIQWTVLMESFELQWEKVSWEIFLALSLCDETLVEILNPKTVSDALRCDLSNN